MATHPPLMPFGLEVDVALRDVKSVADVCDELAALDPEFTASERGSTVVSVSVLEASALEARRPASNWSGHDAARDRWRPLRRPSPLPVERPPMI